MPTGRFLLFLMVAALPVAGTQPAPAAELKSVAVEGTEFVVTLRDGKIMRSPDLVGAVLDIGAGGGKLLVRIDAVERDPDAKGGAVWLHSFSTQAADGAWRNLTDHEVKLLQAVRMAPAPKRRAVGDKPVRRPVQPAKRGPAANRERKEPEAE